MPLLGGDVLVGLTTIKVKDKVTGNEGHGSSDTKEKAEAKAWEDLKKKQGPPPSQSGGS